MPPERYSKDMVLTAEDFAECGWKEVLESAKDKSYRLVHSALYKAARQATDEGRQAHGKVLWLLADACSMQLSPVSVNEPFKPFLRSQDGWPIPDDFSEIDITLFAEVVGTINDPWLKARLADLVWLIRRDFRFALMAIDSYRSIPLNTETWLRYGEKCWQRAISLALMLGAGDRLAEIEASIFEVFRSVTKQDGFLGFWLADLLKSHALGSNHATTIATKLETLAREFDQDEELHRAREYFRVAADWFKVSGDNAKSYAMTVEVAEGWVKEAVVRLSSNDPSHLVAARFYENAIQIYRTIPGAERAAHRVDERMAELRARLSESGEKSLDEMKVISTPGADISQIVENARKAVRGKEPVEALEAFVNLYPGVNVEELRNNATERLRNDPSSSLFPTQVIGSGGRTVAKNFGDDEKSIISQMIQEYSILVDIVVWGDILPAQEILLLEHRLREADFIGLARQSPFVPIGRELLFGKALYAGYDRDFVTGLHLLVPQIEHAVRFHLKQAGVKTTTLDSKGIETENVLGTLMGLSESEQIFGEDLSFEIRALFCDLSGPNLRNNLAHGLLDDRACLSAPAIYAWWFGLKLVFNALTERRAAVSMKNPPHPGKVVRVSCLEPLGLNVTEGAKVLGVSRQALSNLVNGRTRMSADMAVRLAKAFGSTTEPWIRLQAAYDIAQARVREAEIEVERYEPRPAVEQ